MANDLVRVNTTEAVLAKSKKIADIHKLIFGTSLIDSVKRKDIVKVEEKKEIEVKKTTEIINYKISDDQNRVIEFSDNILAWKDTETNLMWEIKNEENIKHCYVWSKEDIAESIKNGWDTYLTDDVKDAFSYAKKLNKINYCGFNDWRVPTIDELKTILTKEESEIVGYANTNYYIKRPLSKNTTHWYWSSSSSANSSSYAWSVYFNNGYAYNSNKVNSLYVRCVR